ncbi:hypothetical protein [Shouchella lehensis]|uniref:Uncharacterized protein n=1 Tax=Shouchella lehensis G1 TaxID=1246626 RepID=A0A060M1L9_9BACI|nr:hypothetical protein [Shouchella lehensis]AIC94443.1 hypothetical protein BleG1_1865 [Shouchella lehensis G1]
MNTIFNFAKKMINGMDRRYLIKSYIFGALIFSMFLYVLMLTGDFHFIVFLFFLLNFFLFPFATVVWDDLIDLLLSGNQLLLPILFVIPWKMFKMIILYMFAIVIAPIGLIYIYISNGYYKKTP